MEQGKDEGGAKARPKIPRLYHTKSKGGCQRCRARRVKVSFCILKGALFMLLRGHVMQPFSYSAHALHIE
jgi:hypothetical protein